MSDIVIAAENLSKSYLVGHQSSARERYSALRDVLAREARNFARKGLDFVRGRQIVQGDEVEEFWALRDVSFEVRRGEVLGIIGRNGAGKSTLLKILSRITEPTRGRVTIRGRVASLLEVGTGFHPELTGRENIYLNGAILGMTQREIRKKFEEIVAFAEVEPFLDTPVKRYSSGMYVRLAFAVAAHLEPEILVVDEVLAVGDAAFQKKCLGKMSNIVAQHGRTVVFVSHNMGVIREFVSRGVWLDQGHLAYDGNVSAAISSYLESGEASDKMDTGLCHHPNRLPRMKKILRSVELKTEHGERTRHFSQDTSIVIEIHYDAKNTVLAGCGVILKTVEGIVVGGFNTYMAERPPHRIPSTGSVRFTLPARQLTPGKYLLTVSVGSHQSVLEDKVEDCINFEVHAADIYGTGYLLSRGDGVAPLFASSKVEAL
jgi:lipopolysaccharide transport system ATP-binding protein